MVKILDPGSGRFNMGLGLGYNRLGSAFHEQTAAAVGKGGRGMLRN